MTNDPRRPGSQDWQGSHDWREAAGRLAANDEWQQRELARHDRLLEQMASLPVQMAALPAQMMSLTNRVDDLRDDINGFREETRERSDRADKRQTLQIQGWQLMIALGMLVIGASGGIFTIARALILK